MRAYAARSTCVEFRERVRKGPQTRRKHAQLREEIDGWAVRHFLLVEQPKAWGRKTTGMWRSEGKKLLQWGQERYSTARKKLRTAATHSTTGRQWHLIVGQCQCISAFTMVRMINSTSASCMCLTFCSRHQ